MNELKTQIQELYLYGLEKFAGEDSSAREFVKGFLKEASFGEAAKLFENSLGGGYSRGIGAGLAALTLGLGIHGVSSMINSATNTNLRSYFEQSLSHALKNNPLLEDAEPNKVRSYAETIFKFAPHVAADPNLLTSILSHVIQGEGVDSAIIKTITDLESKLVESRKGILFSPKNYI